MDRRTFLLGSTGLIVSALGSRTVRAAPEKLKPWFDPSYGALPTAEQQVQHLDAAARAAQEHPRTVRDLPVTGLPLHLGEYDEQVTGVIKAGGLVGVGIAIAVNHQLIVTRGYGYLSSHDRVPATPTSPGYLGSITKPLCAMTGLMLVKAQHLKLDQKVMHVLPMEPLLKAGEQRQPEIDEVTVRMLMNHTSGLFNVVEELFDPDYYRELAAEKQLQLVHGDISQYDLVRRGMSKPFVSKPGTEYHYSGQGLQVLGRIIEKLSGQRLDKCMASKVLEPLGIKHHATMSYLAPEQFAQLVAGKASQTASFIPSPWNEATGACESWNSSQPNADFYGHHWGHADACGASMLSVVDLLRFAAFCPERLGKPLAMEALTPPPREPFSNGLGWGVSMTEGHLQYGHGGAFGGIRAFCESTWDGIQYAVVVAGDRDEQINAIIAKTVEYGRSLRDTKAPPIGWKRYGFK
ncbi:MAG TPA: serine hydrolase domain-containing protein [Planctomycetaceae bacterium]|nr:serine hydrolase domain-containing protein [Planctomycetaceae bacterium]